MALVRWSPIRQSQTIENEMNDLMSEFFGTNPFAASARPWAPALEIRETPEAFVLQAEVPGMRPEDVKITLDESRLTLRGEKRRDGEKADTQYHRTERAYGEFERSITLPHKVSADKIEATYRDGVLEVTIPKAEEAKAREIPIKVSK